MYICIIIKDVIMQITKENTVAEVVSKNVGSDQVFSKYKIDFCCGGYMTLETACKESGVEFNVLKFEIETIKNIIAGNSDLNTLDLSSLIKYTSQNHHKYFDENIAQLLPLAAKVAQVHAIDHPEVVEINMLFSKATSEILKQISLEENNLFPFIKKINGKDRSFSSNEETDIEIFKQSIKNIESAFTIAADIFKKVAISSSNYIVPEGACNSYKFLYEKLEEFEHELHRYIHFEKNILFPKLLNIN